MKIGILTLRDKYARGSTIFYPLIKWQKQFAERDNIEFDYYRDHTHKKMFNNDVVIIDSRYCRHVTVHDKAYSNLDFMKETIGKLKKKGIRVILFDNADSAGGRYFELIDYVDLHVKKQVLKDRTKYLEDKGIYSYRVYLEGYDLSEEKKRMNALEEYDHVPCPPDQLHKIKLGWNIGFEDYRYFPMSRFYPVGTTGFFNQIYKMPRFNTDLSDKPYSSSFRGAVNLRDENYSFQRNKVIELFKNMSPDDYVTGGKVNKKEYLTELRQSKICVSPFGWGEVCFRDFEGVISGCVLLKPDMSHLETYPDIYEPGVTYESLRWNMSDLEEKLQLILNDYDSYSLMVHRAQQKYKEAVLDFDEFRERFLSLVA